MKPPNDQVAMAFCPSWSNVPPISLAYIKGAVKNRNIQCFDFNHDLFVLKIPDYRNSFQASFPAIRSFRLKQPNFEYFERAVGEFTSTYRSILEQWAKQLQPFGIVGFSIYQENILASTVLARLLKRTFNTLCIAGGPSMNMDEGVFTNYLIKDGTFSYAVMGIAEDIIEDLLNCLTTGNSISEFPRLVFQNENREIIRTLSTPSNLTNFFSPPNYDNFDLDDYWKGWSNRLNIYAVTGCKGRCKFCTISEFYQKYSSKSIENITKEMLYLRGKYSRNHIFFSDGMFLGNRDAAMALFDFAIANDFHLGIQIRLMPYWNDEKLINRAAQCVFFLQIGFESASPKVRRAMGKFVNQEITMSIFRLFYKYELPLYTNIIIGYPNETDEDFKMTYDFLREYLQQSKRLGIGTNSFFLPNNFPTEEYHIRLDSRGHWQSDTVSIEDRVSRVSKICNLANKLGLPRGVVYSRDSVEGIPLQLGRSQNQD